MLECVIRCTKIRSAVASVTLFERIPIPYVPSSIAEPMLPWGSVGERQWGEGGQAVREGCDRRQEKHAVEKGQ